MVFKNLKLRLKHRDYRLIADKVFEELYRNDRRAASIILNILDTLYTLSLIEDDNFL